ncbi:DUF4129 domain-containing protein [Mycobacterium sp. IDR2000157661]|uniref:DUF4129 domain-containing protein n=1 Tax=Mycobacterium sp. IDR2000157661 TaxID=2867005 RepID=UPI001EEDEB63|nr:DUF4129 domain-containing protein [Mycobacterium sp. IDR2000157661]ULE34632.1 DUF4129 domain-containing protein [Mycobacterium sp. IDR2000157661]
MSGIDTSIRRVIVVITLIVLAAWALRGYVPGSPPPADESERPESNPMALAAVLVLLCAAVAIIGFAIISRMRDPRPTRPAAGALPRGASGAGRPSWRFALIALAAIVGWLALVTLLSGVDEPGPIESPASTPSEAADADPPAPGDGGPPSAVDEDASDTNVVNYLIPPMLILMALVVVGTAVASRRQTRIPVPVVDDFDAPVAQAPAAATSLARAAEIGLAEIGDLSREPREAIIACYAAMERELGRVPGAVPQDFDTPTEVLARAVDSGALPADSATELVELFEEARFSPHVMSEEHRDAAVRVLHRVLTELPQRSSGATR